MFVDSLTGHARLGMFRPDRPNIHAVMCALYDVNKKYGTRSPTSGLKQMWRSYQNKRARCYVNAAEELCEELCILFNRDNEERNDVIDSDHFDLNVPAPVEGWVDPPPPRANEDAPITATPILNNANSSGSSSSSSFWAALDAYYGSHSDADSVLPVPGIPSSRLKTGPTASTSPKSPKSVGVASSSASNAIPIKKEDCRRACAMPCHAMLLEYRDIATGYHVVDFPLALTDGRSCNKDEDDGVVFLGKRKAGESLSMVKNKFSGGGVQ
ncbi:hypothetical protein Salat_0662100 [Sesamum alatum]|uniref:Uncharacterized protein n=1 Tax=Sesamum alatum TaxID=300844 RepID=A0AAE2CUE5_9LAMI|nr:hypothetical protein Salat_0662100 [Sesamum alatum]